VSDGRISMRKVVAVELVSLDGVMESPEEWAFSYSNDEMEEANASGMAASYINSVPKYVASTTLEEPLEWNNSTLIRSNVAEEIARLKRQPGQNTTILGSGALLRSLLRDDLVDELRLIVHPVVLGGGKRLFEGGRQALELVDSKTFSTGVLYLTYQPPQS
jgi:dihydrofolate reductase